MGKALVVDDEEDICEFLGKILTETFGFTVQSAISGEKALELIKQEEMDLCLVDLKLSTAVTGLDVITGIRDIRSHAKVIAMSGYVDIGLRQKAENLGVSDFFEKPRDLHPDIFESKIRNLLQK